MVYSSSNPLQAEPLSSNCLLQPLVTTLEAHQGSFAQTSLGIPELEDYLASLTIQVMASEWVSIHFVVNYCSTTQLLLASGCDKWTIW